jgi:microcystin-dependent protein
MADPVFNTEKCDVEEVEPLPTTPLLDNTFVPNPPDPIFGAGLCKITIPPLLLGQTSGGGGGGGGGGSDSCPEFTVIAENISITETPFVDLNFTQTEDCNYDVSLNIGVPCTTVTATGSPLSITQGTGPTGSISYGVTQSGCSANFNISNLTVPCVPITPTSYRYVTPTYASPGTTGYLRYKFDKSGCSYDLDIDTLVLSNPTQYVTVVTDVCVDLEDDNSLEIGAVAGGDLSGTYPDPQVVGLRGRPISSATPTTGQVLSFNGTQWVPTTLTTGSPIPVGSVFGFLNAVPSDFLELNGAAVSRTTYAALFSYVGTLYGPGDGFSTFNLPDARGRALIGAGLGTGLTMRTLGTSLGAETHTLTVGELAPHSHAFNVLFSGSPGISVNATTQSGQPVLAYETTTTGFGQAHNNMQPSLVIRWAVKF